MTKAEEVVKLTLELEVLKDQYENLFQEMCDSRSSFLALLEERDEELEEALDKPKAYVDLPDEVGVRGVMTYLYIRMVAFELFPSCNGNRITVEASKAGKLRRILKELKVKEAVCFE